MKNGLSNGFQIVGVASVTDFGVAPEGVALLGVLFKIWS